MNTSIRNKVYKAQRTHTDLNTFHSLIAILEGGCLYMPQSQKGAQRIIALCKAEAHKCLRAMDKAIEEIEEATK